MNLPNENTFYPDKTNGLAYHFAIAVILGLVGCIILWLAMQQDRAVDLVLLLLGGLLLLVPVPFLVYRGYALFTSRYTIDRQGLRIRWGLRAEDLPIGQIEWMRRSSEFTFPLPVPRLNLPGVLVGKVTTEDLGSVEFLASDVENLVLVATRERIFALSPLNPPDFIKAYRKAAAVAGATQLKSFSSAEVSFMKQVWQDVLARFLVLGGAGMTFFVLLAVLLTISLRSNISIGFEANGNPYAPGPSGRLLLFPTLSFLFLVYDTFGGMFFYRQTQDRIIAYIIWGSSLLIPLSLMIAILFFL